MAVATGIEEDPLPEPTAQVVLVWIDDHRGHRYLPGGIETERSRTLHDVDVAGEDFPAILPPCNFKIGC
jgi:hypothetical protein